MTCVARLLVHIRSSQSRHERFLLVHKTVTDWQWDSVLCNKITKTLERLCRRCIQSVPKRSWSILIKILINFQSSSDMTWESIPNMQFNSNHLTKDARRQSTIYAASTMLHEYLRLSVRPLQEETFLKVPNLCHRKRGNLRHTNFSVFGLRLCTVISARIEIYEQRVLLKCVLRLKALVEASFASCGHDVGGLQTRSSSDAFWFTFLLTLSPVPSQKLSKDKV